MLKWLVFAAMWIAGLFIGDALAASEIGGRGSRLVFFGGMWMLACVGAKDFIAGYQEAKARRKTPNAIYPALPGRTDMLMKPPTLPADYVPAVHTEELVHALQMIAHATAPSPAGDGGHHEAAYELAIGALKRVEARQEYEKKLSSFDAGKCDGDGA